MQKNIQKRLHNKLHKFIVPAIVFVGLLVAYVAVFWFVNHSSSENYYLTNEWTIEDKTGVRTEQSLSDVKFQLGKNETVTMTTTLPEIDVTHPMLKLWFYHSVFQVRVDGNLIFESGYKEINRNRMVPNGVFFVALPEDYQGKLLEITFTSQIKNPFAALPNITFQQESILINNYYRSDAVQIAIGFFLLIVGFLFIVTAALYHKDKYITKRLVFIGSISVLTSCWLFVSSGLLRNLTDMSQSLSELEYILLYVTPLVVVLYVRDRQVRPLFQKISKILIGVLCGFVILSTLLNIIHLVNYAEVLLLFHLLVLVVLGFLLWFTIYNCFVNKDKSEQVFLYGIAIMMALLLFDIVKFNIAKFMTTQTTDTNDIIIPISILILVFSMIQSSIVGILKNIETNIEKQLTERITSKDGLTGLVCRTKCVDYLNDETEDALVIGFDIKNLGQINEYKAIMHEIALMK